VKLGSTGTIEWQSLLEAAGRGRLRAVERTLDDSYIAVGEMEVASLPDLLALKLDDAGVLSWATAYAGSYMDVAASVDPTADGGYLVAGYTQSFGATSYSGWLLKLTGTGLVEWERRYGDVPYAQFHSARATSDGGYAVAGRGGSLASPLGTDLWALKLDGEGLLEGLCPFVFDTEAEVRSISTATIPSDVDGTLIASYSEETTAAAEDAQAVAEELCCVRPQPPGEISPPGAAAPLLFKSRTELSWESSAERNACYYNLYRGEVANLPGLLYGDCLESGLEDALASDPEPPTPETPWFYLVTGVNDLGEGPMGSSSVGEPRVPATPCP
jgi:hypothetical protein